MLQIYPWAFSSYIVMDCFPALSLQAKFSSCQRWKNILLIESMRCSRGYSGKENKCNRPLKPGHSPSPPRPSLSELKCIQQPPPFHSSAVTCLTWKKRHNIGLRLICGFVCQLLSIVTARTIQAVSRRVYLIGFPSWPQPVTMCFHWSVFPDHSAPMALTGPS